MNINSCQPSNDSSLKEKKKNDGLSILEDQTKALAPSIATRLENLDREC